MTPKQQRFVQDRMAAEFKRIKSEYAEVLGVQELHLSAARLEAMTDLHGLCENGIVGSIDRATCKAWRNDT